jgi:hypothetical protein
VLVALDENLTLSATECLKKKQRLTYEIYKRTLTQRPPETLGGTYYYGVEENIFRSQGPEGGFCTGYDQS